MMPLNISLSSQGSLSTSHSILAYIRQICPSHFYHQCLYSRQYPAYACHFYLKCLHSRQYPCISTIYSCHFYLQCLHSHQCPRTYAMCPSGKPPTWSTMPTITWPGHHPWRTKKGESPDEKVLHIDYLCQKCMSRNVVLSPDEKVLHIDYLCQKCMSRNAVLSLTELAWQAGCHEVHWRTPWPMTRIQHPFM